MESAVFATVKTERWARGVWRMDEKNNEDSETRSVESRLHNTHKPVFSSRIAGSRN